MHTLRDTAADDLPKGISSESLQAVVAALRQSSGAGGLSAAEVATTAGSSRVTARRYLEYLVTSGVAVRSARYRSAGRPEVEYRLVPRNHHGQPGELTAASARGRHEGPAEATADPCATPRDRSGTGAARVTRFREQAQPPEPRLLEPGQPAVRDPGRRDPGRAARMRDRRLLAGRRGQRGRRAGRGARASRTRWPPRRRCRGARRPDPSAVLQPFAEQVRRDTGTDFVVIMTADGIRYTHPNPARSAGTFRRHDRARPQAASRSPRPSPGRWAPRCGRWSRCGSTGRSGRWSRWASRSPG